MDQFQTGTVMYPLPLCAWCRSSHSGKCPLVKSIEYHTNGTVKRVEFFEPAPVVRLGLNEPPVDPIR